ncbi:hypothetical protein BH24ACT5_BH24ACT5_24560 [soil metagenome]
MSHVFTIARCVSYAYGNLPAALTDSHTILIINGAYRHAFSAGRMRGTGPAQRGRFGVQLPEPDPLLPRYPPRSSRSSRPLPWLLWSSRVPR